MVGEVRVEFFGDVQVARAGSLLIMTDLHCRVISIGVHADKRVQLVTVADARRILLGGASATRKSRAKPRRPLCEMAGYAVALAREQGQSFRSIAKRLGVTAPSATENYKRYMAALAAEKERV